MMTCPCGSELPFANCCAPLLDGQPAVTAEALMRSRYTAFARRHADHLFRTWHPRTRPAKIHLDPTIEWTGLRILATKDGRPDDTKGTVSFEACWQSVGDGMETGVLRETSRFERRAGRWFYLDGDVVQSQ